MSDKLLANFLIPRNMNDEIKTVCEERGFTRTSYLLHLIHNDLVKRMKSRQEMQQSLRQHNLPEFYSTSEMEVVSDW